MVHEIVDSSQSLQQLEMSPQDLGPTIKKKGSNISLELRRNSTSLIKGQ